MSKTEKKIALYVDKIARLISKGLITESDIIDSIIKAEYQKKK